MSIRKINKRIITLGIEILIILMFGVIAFFATTNANAEWETQSNGLYYNYPSTEPSISSITPSYADNDINHIKTRIIVTGNGFNRYSTINIDGVGHPTKFIDSRNLIMDLYPGEIKPDSTGFFLTVFNRDSGEYSNAIKFKIGNASVISVRNTKITTVNNTNVVNTTSKTVTSVQNNNSKNILDVNKNDVNESYGELSANVLNGSGNFMPTGLVQWMFTIILVLAIIILWRYVHRSEEKYMSSPMKHA